MKPLLTRFFEPRSIAVVGASNNSTKYGYKVFMDLKNNGYDVYPVNLKEKKIKDYDCYSSLKTLPIKPDVVITIVPSRITKEIVKQASELNINKIWMQPGSESNKAISYCKKNNMDVISNQCVIINKLK